MKKIILILFFFVPNLVNAKIITLNNCYEPNSDGILTPSSLKEVKIKYKKDKITIDIEKKTITFYQELNDNYGDYLIRKYIKIYRLDYFDGRFAKGSNPANDDNIKSITFDLKDNTFVKDTIWKQGYFKYKCENTSAVDILKKIIGK